MRSSAFEPRPTRVPRIGWTRVIVPERDVAQAIEFPVSLALFIAMLVMWALLTPLDTVAVDHVTLIEMAFALPPLHAAARVAALGREAWRRDDDGGEARRISSAPYRPIGVSRARYIAMLAMPLVALSIVPMLGAAIARCAPGEIVAFSLFNALVSGSDVLAAALVIAQVPAAAEVRGFEDAMAWKPLPVTAERVTLRDR